MAIGILIGVVIGLIVGGGGIYALIQINSKSAIARARQEAQQIVDNARREGENRAKEIELAAKQDQLRAKEKFEREHEGNRRKLEELETRLSKREDTLDKKLDTLTVKERHLDDLEEKVAKREQLVTQKETELTQVLREQRERLLSITNLSLDQAKELLLKRIEDECRQDCGALILRMTEQAQEEAKEKSRQILLQAIQRYAAEQTSDHTVSTVTIPTDDMKAA